MNEINFKSHSNIPCLEDVIDKDKIREITFEIELYDIFDKYMFSDLKVIETTHEEYKGCSYVICRDCFKEILKELEGDNIE